MRALLVVNPAATTTTARGREVLARALASELKVEVEETSHRGHAAALAVRAAREGLDLVVALGGDGTVNEVVNGLLTDGPRPGLPALAVVPGGSTNVFVRAVGLPVHPFDATGVILEALRAGRARRIGLGLADDRWFTFNAGYGFDAEVVRRIERRRRAGEQTTHARVRPGGAGALLLLLRPPAPGAHPAAARRRSRWTGSTSRWSPTRRRGPTSATGRCSPARRRPSRPASTCSRRGRCGRSARCGTCGARCSARHRRGSRRLLRVHDVTEFTLRADRPMALQVDGDWLGERESVRFRAVPDVLRVVV